LRSLLHRIRRFPGHASTVGVASDIECQGCPWATKRKCPGCVEADLSTIYAIRTRRRVAYQAIREATLTTARREAFRTVRRSIQRAHLHLSVEADHRAALAVGMQGFQISAAKPLNAALSRGKPGPRRRGTVFPDRYHAEVITSPRQARHTLSYVMNNW